MSGKKELRRGQLSKGGEEEEPVESPLDFKQKPRGSKRFFEIVLWTLNKSLKGKKVMLSLGQRFP